MYREFKQLNLSEIDQEILAFWEKDKVFEKSVDQRDPDNSFVFFEGPPSANGKPGIHHVMARTIKDLFCRYQAMKGKRVERKGGWDTHGLPIELSVEKELGITKEDIGKTISVDEYNQKCRETVMRYKDMWDDITRKMGYWVDLDNPYVTYTNDYIESVWWLLGKLYEKDMLYKGFTIQPYSPAAGTGLSSHELNMPGAYQDIKDVSAIAQFKIKGADEEYFLAWTTTPWTLPSNTALAVGKNITYVKVRAYNRYTHQLSTVILAKERLSTYFTEANPALNPEDVKAGNKPIAYLEIVGEIKGSELEGMQYEQLLPYVTPDKPAFRVLIGDFVSTEDGTGIVHIAPTFGADDFRIANQYGIPPLMVKDELDNLMPLVDKQGRFVKEVTDFAGRYVKDYGQKEERSVDADIVIKLKEENKLFHSEKYTHSYPHCWRTDRPVLYYPLDSWFIRASAAKDRMYELNKTINWKPASTGEGRFGKWLENLQDWNLSRSRYWGIPLPIWRSKDGIQEKCISSVEQLRQEIQLANEKLGKNQQVPKDLHRPYIDEIVLVGKNGDPLFRELDLIDVWFDSGSMPYAQWHYPFEYKEKFNQNFPADFIAEGVDQTRGWFYTLHAIATMVFDSVAFKNVVSNGLVQDKHGRKMSKRLGNAPEPFETIATYGADPTRWYMMSNSDPWENLKFDTAGIDEIRRKFFGTLYNTYSFFVLYANIDQFRYQEKDINRSERPEIDRWVISLLNSLVKEVDAAYANYDVTTATRKIMLFVDNHLSNWYVRLCRRRFWKGDYSEDKIAAYQTLYQCLTTISKLIAPVAPFFSDWLYKNLNDATQKEGYESVHLADFPQVDELAIDSQLEQRMDYAQRISSLVLSLRKKENIRVRQPLQKIMLPILDASFQQQVEDVKDLILSEVNIKEFEYITDTTGVIKKKIKPNFKTLGKRLGKNMKTAAQLIGSLTQEDISVIEQKNSYTMSINGDTYELTLVDFEIVTEDIPGWQVASDGPLTVALDITITDELKAEGLARELVNRIQNIRKDRNFNVTDKILVQIEQHTLLEPVLSQFGSYIETETLTVSLEMVRPLSEGEKVELPEVGELYILVNPA
ncbi:MAG: isoleucine--tRNA ligase [Saprospiraceae bacterium]|nr:MAG: isoleucine--tRNA ligase [Saprospiraceae bacterium]